MAYQVLARKYRPQRFADVAGQDHVTVTLMNALTQQRIAHGYIFSGHRGIGKTTIARILAMALNCRNVIGSEVRPTAEPCEVCESCTEIRAGNAVDVIEIDAATNRGIDEIRELRDAARYRPARDKYKIYILDEAHQITDAAFNALLKTLEEPPDHIVFMMATTQPEDIPQTVRSRCQHFSFHAVKLVDILGELRGIATREGLDADDAALGLLAEAGDGSMRDALSIMDQAIASAPVEDGRPRLDAAQIRELMGTVPNAAFESIFEAVDANRSAEVMTLANRLLDAGNSPAQLARQCVRYLRNCLIAKIAGIGTEGEGADGAAGELLQISVDEQRRAGRTAALFTEEELTRFLQMMLRTFDELGYRQEQRFHFELGLLKLVHLRRLLPVEELLSQFPAPSGTRTAGGDGGARGGSAPARQVSAPASTPASSSASASAPSRPSFSPFEQSKKRFDESAPETVVKAPVPVATAKPAVAAPIEVTLQVVEAPKPMAPSVAPVRETVEVSRVAVLEPEAEVAPVPEEAIPQQAEAEVEPIAVQSGADEEGVKFQRVAVEALQAVAKQTTAAEALDDAVWTVAGGEIRVQMEVSKTMLPMVVNAEAEKIVRAALREGGAGALKLALLPGTGATSAAKKPRVAKSGSAEALAAKHPVVQAAQRLFNAEIRNVIDLRDSD
ncbi:DNA polymerase III subunit gamma/tau [Granulicella sp. dw_53]|uniref:DNA polymerase III subunit gamma/tau n=1 Tax=Granulicella sp. dw_53 TaxID=2719792 RepID=UPI001BD3272E|nr:DNA polymerase III subunit gamma/tau [Granulicella sp. dw_53]